MNRLDRVYFRSSGSAPQLEDIRIVGDTPCSKTVTPHLFISDHFGLITTFTIPSPQVVCISVCAILKAFLRKVCRR